MSEIQEAIELLKPLASSERDQFKGAKAIRMAISALQEQEEREKDCSYKHPCGWCSLFDEPCNEVCCRNLSNSSTPENNPLTLEQLRQMDGKPVWCKQHSWKAKDGFFKAWGIIDAACQCVDFLEIHLDFNRYGQSWLAYAREPVNK